jgi:uncharacterized protein (DUF2384 family)
MIEFQIRSASKPFDQPEIVHKAVLALTLADAMGILPRDEPIEHLDSKTFRSIAKRIADVGIARTVPAELEAETKPRVLRAVIDRMIRALEESPLPAYEWPALLSLLGAEMIADLVGISRSSVLRYASSRRDTPGDVADRLHFLALVVGDLAGTYNAEGIRRWFQRPRAQLGDKSPQTVLGRHWHSDSERARRVRALARALTASPAT